MNVPWDFFSQNGGPSHIIGAGEALSLEEERHVTLAKAHLVLAARCRARELRNRRASRAAQADWDTEQSIATTELNRQLKEARDDLFGEKSTMLVALRGRGHFLNKCSLELRNDPEVVTTALEGSKGGAFPSASPELRADKTMVLKAVELDGKNLSAASENLRGDREVVLTAVQSRAWAIQFASEELQHDRDLVLTALRCQSQGPRVGEHILGFIGKAEFWADKDFILLAMRTAQTDDHECCYHQAHRSISAIGTLTHFQGASESLLALAGESAPVLTITLNPHQEPAPETTSAHPRSITTCTVTLMSGASFTCQLAPCRCPSNASLSAAPEPALKRAKQGQRETQRQDEHQPQHSHPDKSTFQTVSQLAAQVLAELPKHTEVLPPSRRAFFVFDKNGEAIQVTPWDWNRPLQEFL